MDIKKSNNNVVVHIGLGKTGTTSLQKNVFPALEKLNYFDRYNPIQIMNSLNEGSNLGSYKHLSSSFSPKLTKENNLFISDERLVGWNPSIWLERCEEIKNMFGSEATIIITLREPIAYLRSMYQQMIHQGNVIEPHDFFLPTNEYEKFSKITRYRFNEVCDIDSFNYEYLVEMYANRFSKVIVVPFSGVKTLKYLSEITDIKSSEISQLSSLFATQPKKNQAYSDIAMKLTFKREIFLKLLGLKSFGTNDRYHRNKNSAEDELIINSDKKLKVERQKLLKEMFKHIFTWRGFMQSFVNNIPISKAYTLPESVWLGKFLEKNIDFYTSLEESNEDYMLIEKSNN